MAAYEVLLLNTSIPQIQAAQSGDTYVVPRDIAFSAALTLSAGTANGVPYLNGSKVLTTGSALTFDGTKLGVGVASAQAGVDIANSGSWTSGNIYNYPAGNAFVKIQGVAAQNNWIGIAGSYGQTTGSANLLLQANFNNTSQQAGHYIGSEAQSATSSDLTFGSVTGGITTNTNATKNELMRLTSTGLGIGTNNPGQKLHVDNSTNSSTWIKVSNGSNGAGAAAGVLFGNDGGDLGAISLLSSANNPANGLFLRSLSTNPLVFGINNTERARITSGGYFKASDTGTYLNATGTFHELRNSANEATVAITNTNASLSSQVIYVNTTIAAGTGFDFMRAYANSVQQFQIRGDGNVYNTNGTYGTLSDQKLKQDIVDAGSQWDDLKAIRFRKYRMKSDVAANPDAPALLGVVAQELEQTSPGLVDEHADKDAEGNDLGTTTKSVKTSVLLMKAAVALQEAMARIEQLEAKVAAMGA